MRSYSYRKGRGKTLKRLGKITSSFLSLLGKGRGYRKGNIKKIVNIRHFTGKIRGREIPIPLTRKFMDFLSFKKIFVMWICIVMLFGFLYFSVTLISTGDGLIVDGPPDDSGLLTNSIYFSFITATSTGFGDIIPLGLSKVMAVMETIVSMVILAVVVSKLVSFKQEVILEEIYDISLDEKVNRLRSALYLSRSDIARINEKISEGRPPRVMIERLWSAVHSMSETLMDIQRMICPSKRKKAEFVKMVGNFQVELILNSVTLSLLRLKEILAHLNARSYNWRTGSNMEAIKSLLSIVDSIEGYHRIAESSHRTRKRLEELRSARKAVEKHL